MSERDSIYNLQDYATLDLTEEDADEPTPVAGIQDVTIVPQFEINQFYTADSTHIADQFQHEGSVNVEIGYSFFDGEVVKEWLGGSGAADGDMADTSDPQKYELTGEFLSRDGSQQISCTVEGITFPEMPIIAASRGENIQWDLSGTGEIVTGFDVDAPAE